MKGPPQHRKRGFGGLISTTSMIRWAGILLWPASQRTAVAHEGERRAPLADAPSSYYSFRMCRLPTPPSRATPRARASIGAPFARPEPMDWRPSCPSKGC